MDKQRATRDAVADAYNAAILIVLADAHAWNELAEIETSAARQAELRHIASALRRAAEKIRKRADEATG
jgi:hypothetical protein